MKKIIFLFFLALLVNKSISQITLYSENFGTGPTLPTGWVSSAGWAANNTTAPLSTGYTGASGGTQVMTTATGNLTYNNNLSTMGYSNITIIFGANRAAALTTSPALQWSSNGTTWNTITYTDVINNTTWALVNGGTAIVLPAGAAGIANLQIRWSRSGMATGAYKLDDIKIQGTCNPSTITSITASPSPISCGGSSTISAISSGNFIRWYLSSTGGTVIGSVASGSGIIVSPGDTTIYYAEAYNGNCSGNTRSSVTVEVSPGTLSDPVNVIAQPTIICQGSSSSLSATTPIGFTSNIPRT